MKITKDKIVSIEYTLKNGSDEVLDTSEGVGPLEYLHGHENIIPGLEKELEGKEAGATFSVTIAPADGYGEISDELIVEVPLANFETGAPIEVGMQFETGNDEQSRVVTVTKIEGDTVTIDANHDLAGVTLVFDVTVNAVRDATDVEIAEGLDNSGCGCGGCGGGEVASSGCNGCGGGCH